MAELLKCPDCDATFDSAKSLGPHRRMAHGYSVTDGKNDPKRKLKAHKNNPAFIRHKGKFPCPQCDFVAQWRGGLVHHTNKKHPVIEANRSELAKANQDATEAGTNGHSKTIETTDDGNHRLEAAATFAAGRVAQLLESIALKYDLPPRTLTALVLRTVGQATQIR